MMESGDCAGGDDDSSSIGHNKHVNSSPKSVLYERSTEPNWNQNNSREPKISITPQVESHRSFVPSPRNGLVSSPQAQNGSIPRNDPSYENEDIGPVQQNGMVPHIVYPQHRLTVPFVESHASRILSEDEFSTYTSEYEPYPYSDSEVFYRDANVTRSLPNAYHGQQVSRGQTPGSAHQVTEEDGDVMCDSYRSDIDADRHSNFSCPTSDEPGGTSMYSQAGWLGPLRSRSMDENSHHNLRRRFRRMRRRRIPLRRGFSSSLNPRSQSGVMRPITPARPCVPLSRIEGSVQQSSIRPAAERADSEGSGSSSSSGASFSLLAASRRDKLLLLVLAVVDLSSYMCISIMAPFFPQEAEDKGISSTLSGWIFGVFALVQCLASPLFGKLLPHVGTRFLIIAGQFFGGGCCALFGLLEYVPTVPSNMVYIVLCFLLRISLAIGCTASSTASFAVIAYEFSDGATTVFGILEMATGLGLMLGPAIGGVLYEVGGFPLPFFALGGFMLLTIPFMYFLPPITPDDDDEERDDVGLFTLLRIPAILVTCGSVFVGAVGWSILDPTLAPHFDQFTLSPSMLGLVFLLMSAFYALSAPLWGWICDRVEDSSPMMVVGFFICTAGFLLLGPSPLLQLDDYNELWLNLVALAVLGTAISLAVIPTFDKILDAAEKAGLDDSLEMYGMVAGLWGSVYALGDFAGPTVGGMLVGGFGFQWTMTFTAAACLLMSGIMFILWMYERSYGPTQSLCSKDKNRTKLNEEKNLTVSVEPNESTPLIGPG